MMAAASVASSGIVLEVLTKDNYENWSALVKSYLMGQDLWDIVSSSSEERENDWKRKNAKALHAIQLSCGSNTLAQIRKFEKAKEAWNQLSVSFSSHLKANRDIEQGILDDTVRDNSIKQLRMHVETGNWDAAKSCIDNDKDRNVVFSVCSSHRTVLHIAVIAGHEQIVKNLIKEGKEKLLKMQDNRGYTALALAAKLTENSEMAKCMVEECEDLLTMETKDDEIPVLLASAKGQKDMTRYLYSQTPSDVLHEKKDGLYGALLLTRCITAEIFDVTLILLQRSQKILLTHESENLRPLYALAHMPSVFPSGRQLTWLKRFFYRILKLQNHNLHGIIIKISHADQDKGRGKKQTFTGKFCQVVSAPVKWIGKKLQSVWMVVQNSVLLKFSGIKEIYEIKLTHYLIGEILVQLRKRISEFRESELKDASAYDAMLLAAKYGIIELIDSMRQANPDLVWAIDKNKRGIFSHAILNRRYNVFDLIHKFNGRMGLITSREDEFGNTLLHLAAESGPSFDLGRRSGAALQMQRELQLYKKVEKIVHPKCKEAKNADGKKAREVFSESHGELVKAGERWAKETATSFTLVGTLIITIMFAAAFTIPGGNNQDTGTPIFLNKKLFTVFMIADAISLFASSTSVLIFIGILTSRYSEKDFLASLPLKLLAGLFTLFLSVVSMMVAFCAALAMMLRGYRHIVIAAISFASIPVFVFVPTQLPLFIEICSSTIGSGWLISLVISLKDKIRKLFCSKCVHLG